MTGFGRDQAVKRCVTGALRKGPVTSESRKKRSENLVDVVVSGNF